MKKGLIITALSAVLIIGAVYTVSSYSKANTNNISETQNNSQVQTNIPDSNETDAPKKPILSVNNNGIIRKAKDFKLKDLNGKEVSLSDFKGKKVFLNFWATWCPPCKAEMPDIEKLYQETKASDLVILSVDIGEDKNTVKTFIDKYNYNFKVLLDTDQEVALEYNINSIPSSFFIDKDGNIIATHIGAMNLEQMKSYIQKLDQ